MILRIVTPAGKKPIRSALRFFPSGQPEDKGGSRTKSIMITPKLHNNMKVDPTYQLHKVVGRITNIKGTRETDPEIKSEWSKSIRCFCKQFLTKKL